MEDFFGANGLVDVVRGGYEEGGGEEEEEGREGCRVEDSEEGDPGAGKMHDGDMGIDAASMMDALSFEHSNVRSIILLLISKVSRLSRHHDISQ